MLREGIQIAAEAIEVLAVAIILAGVISGTLGYLWRWTQANRYERYKETLDRALLLGLNVLVAADIIRTVALEPTLTNIAGLGLLVLVRTFLSWSLFIELEGGWPWEIQHKETLGADRPE